MTDDGFSSLLGDFISLYYRNALRRIEVRVDRQLNFQEPINKRYIIYIFKALLVKTECQIYFKR